MGCALLLARARVHCYIFCRTWWFADGSGDCFGFFSQLLFSRQLHTSGKKGKNNLTLQNFSRENFAAENSKTKYNTSRKDAIGAKPMNNSNPFVPQGSLLEQQSKRRSRMKLGVFCVLGVTVVGLMAVLIQGCKREQAPDTNTDLLPPAPTNDMTMTDTNPMPMDVSNNATAMAPSNPPPYVPPVAVAAPPVEPAGTEYVVVAHDTMGKIAKKNGVSLKSLMAANPGVVPTKLKVGQKLTIPASTSGAAPMTSATTSSVGNDSGAQVYVVKSGDTLSKIARKYGTTVKAIQTENNLVTTRITVGKKLKLPAKAEAAAPAPAPEPAPMAPATGTGQ